MRENNRSNKPSAFGWQRISRKVYALATGAGFVVGAGVMLEAGAMGASSHQLPTKAEIAARIHTLELCASGDLAVTVIDSSTYCGDTLLPMKVQ